LQCSRCHTSVGHSEWSASSRYPVLARSTHAKQ
jgi:hypothetical protein